MNALGCLLSKNPAVAGPLLMRPTGVEPATFGLKASRLVQRRPILEPKTPPLMRQGNVEGNEIGRTS
jgi:hypothetical protein